MARNIGKKFEDIFEEDFKKSFPQGTLDRIYDTMNGYKNITNICDYIGYVYPNIFYLECKSHKGASIPFTCISQYEKLKNKLGIKGVRAGVVVYLYEKDVVYYIPISTLKQMVKNGEKSVGIRSISDGYNIIELPSIKKRVYMETDYSILSRLNDNDEIIK